MKNILITGASSGFGKVMAEHLSKLGHNVIGTSRSPDDNRVGDSHAMQVLDVTSDDSVRQCIDEAMGNFGHIDVLINNAGNGISGPIEETPIAKAKEQFDTNFFGVVRMNQAILPVMKKQGYGLIINISSIGGIIGLPYQGFYAASKFALEGYTEALRMELNHSAVNITNICPGDFITGFTSARSNPEQIGSEYSESYNRIMKHYETNEASGSDPILIAKLVERIIKNKGNHPVRYIIGKPIERMAVKLKRILGSKTFEKIILQSFK